MKSKIGLIAVVLASGLALSACTKQSTTNTNSVGTESQTQQQDSQTRPSGTADRKGPGRQMDLASAATKLNVTEEALRAALGMEDMATVTPDAETTPGARPSGQPKQIDLATAAETLGVTEDKLREALGMNNMPSGEPGQGNGRQNGTTQTESN